MRSSRPSLFAPVGVALFTGLLMLGAGIVAPTSALACPEGGGACACGDKCPAEHAGKCAKDAAGGCAGNCAKDATGGCAGKDDKAAAGEKKAGACGCSGAGAAAPGEKAAPCGAAATEGAGAQRAVIDPVTGQLTVPDDAQAAEAAEAAPAQAQAAAGNATSAAQQIAVPGAGVMAPFPTNRVSHAVAKVDESGNAHTGCEHAAE